MRRSLSALLVSAGVLSAFVYGFAQHRLSAVSRATAAPELLIASVSYTHLDVYKRQGKSRFPGTTAGGSVGNVGACAANPCTQTGDSQVAMAAASS